VEETIVRDSSNVEELSPDRVFEGNRRLGIIAKALWGMPKKRSELLMMNRFDGLSYAEIARRVNLSETVVRKHVSRALADCQKALQTKCN
jgi:RNA polymerase sigma-70 factor (ECF subfamily)